MVLLSEQIKALPKGSICKESQLKKLCDFVIFVTHLYSSWWISSHSSTDAPWLDLCLYKQFLKYSLVNKVISERATKAFKKHLWYLTGDCVVFAIFSCLVPVKERRSLADKVLSLMQHHEMPTTVQHRYGTGYGKPSFPELKSDTCLSDLVNEDTLYTIKLLDLNLSFLSEDVKNWQENEHFQNSKTIVKNLNVVNDCSERAVKLASDFLGRSKTEERYQNLLQVVEADRIKRPNLRKKLSF
jgi:hypothetical protein